MEHLVIATVQHPWPTHTPSATARLCCPSGRAQGPMHVPVPVRTPGETNDRPAHKAESTVQKSKTDIIAGLLLGDVPASQLLCPVSIMHWCHGPCNSSCTGETLILPSQDAGKANRYTASLKHSLIAVHLVAVHVDDKSHPSDMRKNRWNYLGRAPQPRCSAQARNLATPQHTHPHTRTVLPHAFNSCCSTETSVFSGHRRRRGETTHT